ncbi:hypothetical protein Zmor_027277 [Zophobas morio]|uniref:Uncharacterized protein n=1 Tax=Zophobas morio TaxID=2755281 RepID=A0AA38M2Q7_9CUCU|nr:hypothetical protein Zmor_027277 [Zophobas morio]
MRNSTSSIAVQFKQEAPDNRFLIEKVILIIGLSRACRRDKLLKMTTSDVEDSIIIIRISDSKNHSQRSFVISRQDHIYCENNVFYVRELLPKIFYEIYQRKMC